MKQLILILSLFAFGLQTPIFAQKLDKAERKAKREQQEKHDQELIAQAFINETLRYRATELSWAPRLPTSNIKLNQEFFIELTEDYFKCHLPVYGSHNAYSGPALTSRLELFLTKGEYTVEHKQNKKGWELIIKVTQNQGVNRYTFTINSGKTGVGAQLSVATDFDGAARYRGDIISIL